MAPENQKTAEELFHDSLELGDDARGAYLDRACGKDSALRSEVESLLGAFEVGMQTLERGSPAEVSARLVAAELGNTLPASPFDLAEGGGGLGDAEESNATPSVEQNLHHFGHYDIIEELGRGGQGTVYRAHDRNLGRQVALKVLSSPLLITSAEARSRFRREAEAASRLDHPALCTVYEAGEVDGTPYIAMRCVEGETLAELIARARSTATESSGPEIALPLPESSGNATPTPLNHLIRFFEETARALHAAHEAGLIHRDIKPGNIVVTADGGPVILDFGLVRDLEDVEPTLTRSGELMGTPMYMSPEQIRGERTELDRTTDVYSLGVTLYETITLRRPFEAATREALYQRILTSEPSNPRQFNSMVPRDLAVVLSTALEKDRSRRYRTALDFAEDLRRIRESKPILARPAGPWLRLRRWTKRNPVVAGLLFLVIASITAGLVSSLSMLRQRELALDESRALNLIAASRQAGETDTALALWIAREAVLASDNPETLSQLHTALSDLHECAILDHNGPVLGVALSPDDALAATVSRRGEVCLWNLDGERLARTVLDGQPELHHVAFSPDGSVLLATGKGAAVLWRWQTDQPVTLDHEGKVFIEQGCFAPDGQSVLTVCDDMYARIWNLRGERLSLLEGHRGAVSHGEFSRDGSRILTASQDRTAKLWVEVVPDQWEVQKTLAGHRGGLIHAEFHPDDERILTASGSNGGRFPGTLRDCTALLWAPDGNPTHSFEHEDALRSAHFSPDGTTVLTAANDRTVRLWDLRGGSLVLERNHSNTIQFANFSTSGDCILIGLAAGTALVIDPVGNEVATLRGHRGFLRRGVLSASGDVALTGGVDHTARLWDLSENYVLPHHSANEYIRAVRFSPDGKFILSASKTRSIKLWDRENRQYLDELSIPGARIRDVVFSPRSNLVAVAGTRDSGAFVQVLPLNRSGFGKPTSEIPLSNVISVEFSPTRPSELLIGISGPSGGAELHDLQAKTIAAFAHQETRSARFDASGDRIVTAGWNGEVKLWDRQGQSLSAPLVHPKRVNSACFSPNGDRILTACDDGNAREWDQLEGIPREQTVGAHDSRIMTARYSSRGKFILSASADGAVRIWNQAHKLVITYRGPPGAVHDAVFDPDAELVATACADGTVRLWIVDPRVLREEVDQRLEGYRPSDEQLAPYRQTLGR